MSPDLAAKLAPLRRRFVDELPARVDTLRAALTASPPRNEDALRAAHSLAGTAGTFGFQTLGETARKLELSLADADSGEWKRLLEAVAAEVAAALKDAGNAPAEAAPQKSAATTRREMFVALVEDDATLARTLSEQLQRFGYRCTPYATPDAFFAALGTEAPPDALIMDIVFPEGGLAGPEAVLAERGERLAGLPVVFMSARGDFAARLAAVRAGGRAYLAKPIDISNLVNTLDAVARDESPRPYRILVVEDSELLATTFCQILGDAGMETRALHDPTRVIEALEDFTPDLMLTDLYMPECSGMELAALIRQMEAWVSLPIVFLSGETDLDRQMQAMQRGGDDFLTKPVAPEHLVASVRQRARRHRSLRAFMVHDSLTGLLNHSALKERLSVELARAERSGAPLAFAMIDLDHFKKVNDTHGHAAGDRVLRALARLLRERLRRTDIAGRYGGEEFALILPGANGDTALRVLEDIRKNFALVEHGAGSEMFSVTLSGGVAAYPAIAEAAALAEAADRALYKSKHAGRNRITLA
ncbi:MAG: diguanylate cyclase [Rhodocyclaceae bacterium]|nr:diguanylate cyclase [Rhodocyclaceae bacterium]